MTAEFKIDQVTMKYPPEHVVDSPPEPTVFPGPGLGKVVVQPLTPPRIEVRWGIDAQERRVINELITKRAQRMAHVITWPDEVERRYKHRNVVIPPIGRGVDHTRGWVDTFTLTMEEYRPSPSYVVIELTASNGITGSADGVAKFEAPAGGRIISVGGFIETLGTGAGSTDIMVSNGAMDYLTSPGQFVVASATGLLENEVLASDLFFDRHDIIELDIDAVPGGSDSADAHVLVYALMFEV